jgi:UDP-N-acetylglucosamine 2-epimerase (non-hydrolysing)
MNRSSPRRILCTIGTRPEAIKMAPLIRALMAAPWARCRVVCTGQHRELVRPILDFFEIQADVSLDGPRPEQSLATRARRLTGSLQGVLATERPDLVLAQGDTTSVLATAWASFFHEVPFGHVEAGLRSGDPLSPFPEEANRVTVSHLSTIHFAPTITARANLLKEGIRRGSISLTGNTVIDALLQAARLDRPIGVKLDPRKKLILVTAHRRDCIGEPLRQICHAILTLHDSFDDVEFLWPVHPNPAVRSIVVSKMSGRPRVRLCEPLCYAPFVSAMKRATLILTDSGGIQEEAPALGKPVLVLRPKSERPEAVDSGVALLVGYDPRRIVAQTSRLLTDAGAYSSMADGKSPYGDGQAAARIVSAIADFLGVAQPIRAAG